MQELFNASGEPKVIGTRHGEKLYETLVSREEMLRVQDMAGYFRVPADSRDLNYDQYFVQGEQALSLTEDYTSHNTTRLTIPEIKTTLLKLDFVKEALHV